MNDEIDSQREEGVFRFPQGVAGFPGSNRFAFIYTGGDVLCMQSLDEEEAALLLAPWDRDRLGAPPKLTCEQRACLSNADDLLWMVVLNPVADKRWVFANLRAPIAISESMGRGLQCIRIEPDLPLRYPWMEHPEKMAA